MGVDTGNGTFINNYYNNSTVGGVNGSDQDGARRGYAVTLGSHVVLVGDQTAYDVSSLTTIGTGNYALSDGSTIYSAEGQSLTVNYTSSTTGYTLSYNYNDGTNHSFDGGTFSMPSSAVTVNATLTTIPWSGSGTEEDPYLIQYPSQLDLLASRVNSQSGDAYAADGYSGKFFQQAMFSQAVYQDGEAKRAAATTPSSTIGTRSEHDRFSRISLRLQSFLSDISVISHYRFNGLSMTFQWIDVDISMERW